MNGSDGSRSILNRARRIRPRGGEVRRGKRVEPLLHAQSEPSSIVARWSGVVLEDYTVPARVLPRHEHVEHFLHVVLEGSVRYEVITRARALKLAARPDTLFRASRGTADGRRWNGPTHRSAAALHPRLLANALGETAEQREIASIGHWNLADPNILAVLLAMRAELELGSRSEPTHGEPLVDALARCLLERYEAKPRRPALYTGGLPRPRLKRVIDYIDENVSGELTLTQLAAVAGMSPHYFAELFRQSTGRAPHQYLLMRRIDLAKEHLRDPRRRVIEVGLDAGFQNPSHFARVFRKWVGTSPSNFRSENRATVPKA